MKLYQSVTIPIDGVDESGRGTAFYGGKHFAVPFAFPGDVVRAQPVRRAHGVLVCAIEDIVTMSPWRVPPRCPHAARSGGCFWQAIEYGKQLEWKRAIAQQAFDAAALPFTIPPPAPSGTLYEFRNKMEYAIGPGYAIGTKAPGRWWEIVDMDGCLLQSSASGAVVQAVRAYLARHGVAPWDCRTHTGYARYVVVREGKFTDERMVILVTAPGELPQVEELIESLKPHATSLYHGINAQSSDTASADTYTHLYGARYLKERIGRLSFFIHPASFFQTNSSMIEALLETVAVLAEVRPHERVLDLYCGLGLFSLFLAPSCAHVMGIEVVPEAIDMAIRNQEENRSAHVQFKVGKVEDLTWVGSWAEVAIVDPPRAGLHPDVVDALVRFGPERLIYVCCNPQAFAREYPTLARAYQVKALRALDLFPHSPHLELVMRLERS
ncbi:23S rRNA (uracil-5-)-methyltransferase RumA [Candidatus Uhrbacteria bacterium RIFCSPHIGHO2_12_FULL_54_23]|uniref:23S rRNA (Uracil-5-)-methyltransferase RumA n=3 Tax=Candidatus Uhriibacteriota TaxID=1752732 RepID=A0A1F7UHZ5_9BACT|nr:MAG: 23S rRNA (uracil-5-)-methyltransferase RumA [Candidatus Uhrbacteria bacterium RIFCSPHIGHO2_12_FULL_54_23]OGL85533.1 MAG: 23S rRNA (uracil-5-)-methyltransferase RumA [Candidatus Uhrbacteria bacterium RIFCSPLOWO2_01_FULL_55_36]OGL89619.1 MAG: 23S rRNA (uracil-5-)-methyltransferase RumA [Candidatus Uhrbacteria bacterium RIFCSPLOWO2_02_FULL_54_37]